MATVTLKNLSIKLGLSVPTVSLALRNAGNISPETCARVQAMARKLGYKPNVYAAALSTGQARQDAQQMPLAILRHRMDDVLHLEESRMHALKAAVTQLGYRLETCVIESPLTMNQELRRLYHRGIQGLFTGSFGREFEGQVIDWSPFSVVQCGRYAHPSQFHSVRSEAFESARFLFKEAIARGYRRIGAVFLEQGVSLIDDDARRGGFYCGQTHVDLGSITAATLSVSASDPTTLTRWLRREKLDAIMGTNADIYHHLLAAGVRLPEDIGFAAFYCPGDLAGERMSGMRERNSELGAAAAKMMDTLIRHHERGVPIVPRTIVIGDEWVEGETLPFRKVSSIPRRKIVQMK
jgi:LacI family transcriptional regulator